MARDRDIEGGRRLRAAVVALYLAPLLAPAHALFEGRVHCSECEAGPSFAAVCEGPESCPDPQHHHHGKPHGHGQCLLCQKGQAPAVEVGPVEALAIAPEGSGVPAAPGDANSRTLLELRSHRARAPPLS